MSLPVIIEPEAKANLRDAVRWWSVNRSTEQALRWYDGIYRAIQTLADNTGGVANAVPDLSSRASCPLPPQ